jgi:hypothetical protein
MRWAWIYLFLMGAVWSGEGISMRVEEPFRPPPVDPDVDSRKWRSDSVGSGLTVDQQKELEKRRKELASMLEAVRRRREALSAQQDPEAMRDIAAWVAESDGAEAGEAGSAKSEKWIEHMIRVQEKKNQKLEQKNQQTEKRLELLGDQKGQKKVKEKKPKGKKPKDG